MIIATVAAIMFFFGSSDTELFGTLMTKYAEDPIKNTVLDEERREKALESLSVLNDDIDVLNKQIFDAVEQLNSLVKNYNSTPQEFDKLFSSTLTKRQENFNKLWDQRVIMLSHIQPEEWQTIISKAKKAAKEEQDNSK